MNKKLANLIKQKRKELGFSQKELAKGISNQAVVCRIENSEVSPSFDVVIKIIKKLNIPIEELAKIYDITAENNSSFFNEEIKNLLYNRDYATLSIIINNTNSATLYGEDKLFYEYVVAILTYSINKDLETSLSKLNTLLEKTEENSYLYLKTLTAIGSILDDNEKCEDSIKYFEKVLPFITSLDKNLKRNFLYSISRVYSGLKNYEKASYYNSELIKELLENKSFYCLGDAYCLQAYIYKEQKLYSPALENVNKALFIFDIEKNEVMKNFALNLLSIIKELHKNEETK